MDTAAHSTIYIPPTVSAKAQKLLQVAARAKTYARVYPEPGDIEAWSRVHQETEASTLAANEKLARQLNISYQEHELGGVPVLDLRPPDWADNGKVIVFAHGGAFTLHSAKSSMTHSAPVCRASGLRVISVDYTPAPRATWKEMQEEMNMVFKGLLAEGYAMADIALYGASAGAGLAISTVLNLRDLGLGMPAAIALWSPWADLTNEGDTSHTLEAADPIVSYAGLLGPSAVAYAGGLQLKDPRVSPLFADYSQGFPPALIQEGTKTIFLSNSARLYQKLVEAGQDPKFDIYEGMVHVFQQFAIPEADIAIKRTVEFFMRHFHQELRGH